jgi:hypothetical protein
MIADEEITRVPDSMQASQNPLWEEWRVNLQKDGGRRVMYGGNAYEDDLEPESGPPEAAPVKQALAGGGS